MRRVSRTSHEPERLKQSRPSKRFSIHTVRETRLKNRETEGTGSFCPINVSDASHARLTHFCTKCPSQARLKGGRCETSVRRVSPGSPGREGSLLSHKNGRTSQARLTHVSASFRRVSRLFRLWDEGVRVYGTILPLPVVLVVVVVVVVVSSTSGTYVVVQELLHLEADRASHGQSSAAQACRGWMRTQPARRK